MIDMHIYRERGGLALNIAPMKYCSVLRCWIPLNTTTPNRGGF